MMFPDAKGIDAEGVGEHRFLDDVAQHAGLGLGGSIRRSRDVTERVEADFELSWHCDRVYRGVTFRRRRASQDIQVADDDTLRHAGKVRSRGPGWSLRLAVTRRDHFDVWRGAASGPPRRSGRRSSPTSFQPAPSRRKYVRTGRFHAG